MGIFLKILSFLDIIKKILDFTFSKIQERKKEKEKKNVIDLSEKTEKNIKEGNLDEINKNLM